MRQGDRRASLTTALALAAAGLAGALVAVPGHALTAVGAVAALGAVLLCATSATRSLFAFLVLQLYAVTWFPQPAVLDSRILSLLPLGVALALSPARGRASPTAGVPWATALVGGVAALSLASSTWSRSPADTTEAGLALVLLTAMMLAARVRDVTEPLRRATTALALALVPAVAAAAVLAPSAAVLGGRFRGVFDNPNGLGVAAAVLGAWLLGRTGRLRWLLLALLAGAVVLSASRGGALALAAALATHVFLVTRGVARVQLLLATAVSTLAVVTWVLPSTDVLTDDSGLLRTNNSREEVWALGLRLYREHVWLGVGADAMGTVSGSTWVKVAAELGSVGLALAGAVAAYTFTRLARLPRPWPVMAVAVAVSSALEGWLFSGGNPVAVLFWLLVATAASSRPSEPEPGTPRREGPPARSEVTLHAR